MTQAWYPFYWSDYSGKTMHLTMSQHGAYMLLLRWVYTTGKPIPANQCYSIARASLEQEKGDVDFVLAEFFHLTDGKWVNDRAFEVMEEQRIKHERRVSAGKQGGKAKSERSSNAKAMPEQSSSNQNQNQNQIGNSNELPPPISPKGRPVTYPPQFEKFWQVYPNRTGKTAALKAYQTALKQHGVTHAILIDRAGQFAAAHTAAGTPSQYIPHPATWLNQGRWEDDLSRIVPRHGAGSAPANARGGQFSAVKSALSGLLQDDPARVPDGSSGLSQWGDGSPDRLQSASGEHSTAIPFHAGGNDPAGRQTIDHDPFIAAHG